MNSTKWQDHYSNQRSIVQNANISNMIKLFSSRVRKLQMTWASPNLDCNWGNSASTGYGTKTHSGFQKTGDTIMSTQRMLCHYIYVSYLLCAFSQESKICSRYFHKSCVINDNNKIKQYFQLVEELSSINHYNVLVKDQYIYVAGKKAEAQKC